MMKQRKVLNDSQIVRAKETLKLSHGSFKYDHEKQHSISFTNCLNQTTYNIDVMCVH